MAAFSKYKPMNRSFLFFFIAISLVLFSACEDVIELDLETTEPQLVIEGTLDAGTQEAKVMITESNDFYDNNAPAQVTGASIQLENENGTSYSLPESAPGIYLAQNVAANPGEQFTIRVTLADMVYEASSIVPSPASLKEIEIVDGFENPFGDNEDAIRLSAIWDDPSGMENFYRIRSYVDDEFQPETYTVITDDVAGDGEELSVPLRDEFEENTTVLIELLSTDEGYYDYFFQLSSIAGEGGNSTTPYNPTGNFNNDVLGYFGIYFSSSLSITL